MDLARNSKTQKTQIFCLDYWIVVIFTTEITFNYLIMSRIFEFEDKVRELILEYSDVPYYEISDCFSCLSQEYYRKAEQEGEI